jgi:bifunctional non-homologous end joining protein LigD
VEREPTGPGWVHEIKHDGYRLLARRREGASVQLFTRKANKWTERFPTIAAAAAMLKTESFTIDGEPRAQSAGHTAAVRPANKNGAAKWRRPR